MAAGQSSGKLEAAPEIRIAAITTQDEFRDAVRLQKEIWQFDDIDLLPRRLFTVATKIGGQAFGAFHDKRMVAFALAIPGIKRNYGGYLHSHMVGVSAAYRNYGVGRMLKLAQREEALGREIELMEWTFDPLEIKNAYFNIERLGIIVRRHVFNQYGTTSSALHGGLPTDRITAEWWLKTDRVQAAVRNERFDRAPIEVRVSVPRDIADIREHDSERAREIQARVSNELSENLFRGLAVIGFEKTETSGDYLLGRWP
jgi:predicted GNAT superfamily acetyltransferase